LLLMDIALLPFAAAVLASSFRDGQGERTAVVFHGISFEIAAALFNVIWWHARHNHQLLTSTDSTAVRSAAQSPGRCRTTLDPAKTARIAVS
jgi:hypothetical protein